MESLGFLKYLRVGGGAVAGAHRAPATTIAASASACEDGGGGGGAAGDVDDDASFFDLEFAVPGDDSAASDADADAEEERVEFNFAVAGDDDGKADLDKAAAPAPPPASPLGPVTKFRVLLLKLRRPAKAPAPADGASAAQPKQAMSRFLVKFRVDEAAPLASLFTRDNSWRTSDAGDRPASAGVAQQAHQDAAAGAAISAEERRFAKEVVLRYLSKIKPLYVKVSRRYGERLRPAGEETDHLEPDQQHPAASPSQAAPPPPPAPVAVVACGVRAARASVPAGLKQVCKRLGKSRSASSAVAAAPSPPASAAGTLLQAQAQAQPQRRDDSLLQVQDGIQSAIAHCKRSFNASKGSESPLLRSMTTAAGDAKARDGGGD
ncbi:hypothetical protein BS78_03G009000 [Paspalum vaginatum]|nr:hypothetical protein BS78_03G009000 [Paspalum vaginatum]KAJ1281903.1 hypothetical protein BS78_03G009000 [Paspalum vaginatum]